MVVRHRRIVHPRKLKKPNEEKDWQDQIEKVEAADSRDIKRIIGARQSGDVIEYLCEMRTAHEGEAQWQTINANHRTVIAYNKRSQIHEKRQRALIETYSNHLTWPRAATTTPPKPWTNGTRRSSSAWWCADQHARHTGHLSPLSSFRSLSFSLSLSLSMCVCVCMCVCMCVYVCVCVCVSPTHASCTPSHGFHVTLYKW